MGKSDKYLIPIFKKLFPKKKPSALLGFSKIPDFMENKNDIDLYDLSLSNFDLNTDWKLKRKYKSIICTRCLYFCKDPIKFLLKCKEYLDNDGEIFIDFFYGHGWTRFKNFKVGWVKNGEHEWEYNENNFLWSGIWDDSFLDNEHVKLFEKRIIKHGYTDLKKAVKDEFPTLIEISSIKNIYKYVNLNFFALWDDMPQLYIFINIKL
jgi:hypothetical protein